MLQLSLTQLTLQGQPLLAQFLRQGFELYVDRLAQPGNVQLGEHVRLLFKRDEFIREATVLQAVATVLQAVVQVLLVAGFFRRSDSAESRGNVGF